MEEKNIVIVVVMSSWELSGHGGHDVIVSSAGEGTTQPSGACLNTDSNIDNIR
jgi:hypothetical protein